MMLVDHGGMTAMRWWGIASAALLVLTAMFLAWAMLRVKGRSKYFAVGVSAFLLSALCELVSQAVTPNPTKMTLAVTAGAGALSLLALIAFIVEIRRIKRG